MEQNAPTHPPLPPQAVIMQVAMAPLMSAALGIAAKLGIADILADGPRSALEIARVAEANEGAVYRILRSLSSIGIFNQLEDGSFVNSDNSDALRTDAPGSVRAMAIYMAEPWHFAAWGHMEFSAHTGKPSWNKAMGEDIFDWFAKNTASAEIFNDAMTAFSTTAAAAVLEAYDFTGISTLADIAGGHGYLLAQILKAYPSVEGILFDQQAVIEGATERLVEERVRERVQTVIGDFFEEVPSADAYLLKHIIHDWDDERSIRILSNIHRAINPGGRVLIVEMVVPPGNEPHPSKVLDLEMLTMTGGLERTEAEYIQLLANAGFRLERIIGMRSPLSIIEAVKA